MRRFATGLICTAVLALAGCSGGNSGQSDAALILSAGQTALASVRGRGGAREPGIQIVPTRADLDATDGQVLQVSPEKLGGSDFLQRIATRQDDFGQSVEVWESSDDAQVILRGGVLVGTKGLGGDMRSADAQGVLAGFDGQGGGGERLMVLDRQDGSAQTVAFSCDVTQLGTEVIQIVDQRVTTRRLREDCVYRDFAFTNEYWVEPGRARVRKSRQWAGPEQGYFTMVLLKNEG